MKPSVFSATSVLLIGLLSDVNANNSTGSLFLQPTANAKSAEIVALDCSLTQSQDADFVIHAHLDKSEYYLGDSLRLEVTPEQNAYITLIDQGSDPEQARGHILFEDIYVEKKTTYTFPPPNLGHLLISGAAGVNTFEIIATSHPRSSFPQHAKDANLDLITPVGVKSSHCIIQFQILDPA